MYNNIRRYILFLLTDCSRTEIATEKKIKGEGDALKPSITFD